MITSTRILSHLSRWLFCLVVLVVLTGSAGPVQAGDASLAEAKVDRDAAIEKHNAERDKCDEAVKKASKANVAYRTAAVHDMWMKSLDRDRQAPKKGLRGEILRNHCLDGILDPNGFFAKLRELFSGDPLDILGALAGQIVKGIMEEMIAKSCKWLETALNNVMESICLPLPNFGFDLNLPDLPALNLKGCSGPSLSMADVIKFTEDYPTTSYPTTMREFVRYARGRTSSGRPIY